MNPQPLPALASGNPSAWEQALYAFLVEKATVRARGEGALEAFGGRVHGVTARLDYGLPAVRSIQFQNSHHGQPVNAESVMPGRVPR